MSTFSEEPGMTVRQLIDVLSGLDPNLRVEVFQPSAHKDSEPVDAGEVFQYSDRFALDGYHDHVVIGSSWGQRSEEQQT